VHECVREVLGWGRYRWCAELEQSKENADKGITACGMGGGDRMIDK
jgi:hypothetical protein